MRKLKLMLDPKTYGRKPQQDNMEFSYERGGREVKVYEPAAVNMRLVKNQTEVTIDEYITKVIEGHTSTVAYFKNGDDGKLHRTKECWAGQDIFALDFDCGILPHEIFTRCVDLKITPTFMYTSFSDTDAHRRFRVVFVTKKTVTDYRDANAITLALLEIFPEADRQCKDLNRFYYGGKEIYIANKDEDDLLTPQDFIDGYCMYELLQDRKSHKRKIGNFCKSVGMNMKNGVPQLLTHDIIDEEEKVRKSDKLNTIYNKNGTFAHILQTDSYPQIYSYNATEEEVRTNCVLQDRGKLRKTFKYNVDNKKGRPELVRNFEFDQLEENCPLWRGFTSGDIYPFEDEFFGIASNMLLVRGGEKRLKEAIEIMPNADDGQKLYYTEKIRYIKNTIGFPTRCENFCPKYGEDRIREEEIDVVAACKTCKCKCLNMLQAVDLKRQGIRQIEELPRGCVDEARLDLDDNIEEALNIDPDDEGKCNTIFGVKAQTGIGKTRNIINRDLDRTLVAVPNHRLKDEIAQRFKEADKHPLVIPELPQLPEELQTEYDKLNEIGAYQRAARLIQGHIQSIIRATPNPVDRTEEEKTFVDYHIATQNARTADFILTTHDKMLFTKFANIDTIIIDEDPIRKLLRQGVAKMDDLKRLFDKTNGSLRDQFRVFYEDIELADDYKLNKLPQLIMESDALIDLIIEEKFEVSGSLIDFLTCDYYIKQGDDLIFIKQKKLPKKKIMIMSATIDHDMYSILYGDRYKPMDTTFAKLDGNLIQHSSNSYSRTHIRNNLDRVIEETKEIGVNNIITFKEFKTAFEDEGLNVIATFGATEGLDSFGGKDLVVVGTPHINPSVYLLYAALAEQRVGVFDQSTVNFVPVIRNGFEFYFNTYSEDSVLQSIQMYLIESELEQAVGRARLLNNECDVHLLSNFPLRDSQLVEG